MKGSLDVPARSTEPPAMARKAPTPPSKRTISTFKPSSLKIPRSIATYGGRCKTLGGVAGTALFKLLLLHVALPAADVAGAGALVLPPQANANRAAAQVQASRRSIVTLLLEESL